MSVIGIDFGTTYGIIAVVRRGGIDIVQNQVSSRQTPCIVGFSEHQRELGEAGKTQALRNVKNTILWPKRLIGRLFKNPKVQEELPRISGANFLERPDGTVGVEVMVNGSKQQFSTEQIVAMLFTDLKQTCEASTGINVADCVISIPAWFTVRQRRVILDASKIAGLNVIGLVNDLTGSAVAQGFYQTELQQKSKKYLQVGLGSGGLQCSVSEVSYTGVKALSHSYETAFGGDEIDFAIANHFANKFNAKYGVRVQDNQRAWYRILMGVDKVKKNLNENESASVSLDCLLNDRDLEDKLSREEYMKILTDIDAFNRVTTVIQQALDIAKVTVDQLDEIEWIGSGMRIVPLRDHCSNYLKRKLTNTSNAEEAFAKGAALVCAFLSPLFKVRDYKVTEIVQQDINIYIKDSGASGWPTVSSLYAAGSPVSDKIKNIFLDRREGKTGFEFMIKYSNPSQVPEVNEPDGVIGHYRVNNFSLSSGITSAEAKISAKLDANGIFTLIGVELVEKSEYTVEVPVEEVKKDDKKEDKKEEKKDEDAMDIEKPSADASKATKTETRVKTNTVTLKVDSLVNYGLSDEEIKKNIAIEEALKKQDAISRERSDAKNAVETFVYNTREKLGGIWSEFGTDEEKSKINNILSETEDWLYGDGENETTNVYKDRLAEMKKLSFPVELRATNWDSSAEALSALQKAIVHYKSEATSGKEEYAHIKPEDLTSIVTESEHVLTVLNEGDKLNKFASRKKTDTPVFLASDLNQRLNNLKTKATKILSTPKPKPAPKAEEPKKEDAKAEGKTENNAEAKDPDAMDTTEPTKVDDAMDTD